jgi:hypothetical protein
MRTVKVVFAPRLVREMKLNPKKIEKEINKALRGSARADVQVKNIDKSKKKK